MHVNAEGRPELPTDLVERAVRAVLADDGAADAEVSLTLLDDAAITELNRRYLGHDRPTDVLSFTLHSPGEPVLGDVYVGLEQAERQGLERGIPLDEELVRLAIHGTLHVLGYDHPQGPDREDSDLFRKQERLVQEVLADG